MTIDETIGKIDSDDEPTLAIAASQFNRLNNIAVMVVKENNDLKAKLEQMTKKYTELKNDIRCL